MSEALRKSVPIGEGAVSCIDWGGAGPVLHFAHANGFNAQTYRTLLSPLADEFHVVASDARGHGFTTLAATEGSARGWNIFRDDLLRLLDALGPEPKILAGHSMGGTATVMAAAMRPQIARAIVLVEPVFVPTIPWLLSRAMSALGLGSRVPNLADRAEKRRDLFPSPDEAAKAYIGRGAFRTWPDDIVRDYVRGGVLPTGHGSEVRLACPPRWEAEDFRETPLGIPRLGSKIECPVTIIYGGKPGGTCRDDEANAFARAHGDTRLVKIPEASHFLPMEFPERVRDEIRKYL